MDRDKVEVHKNAKKERGQYPAILTEQAWSIKDLLYGFTFKWKLQQQNKTGHKTALHGKKFFIAGRCKIYFQCIFRLACNRGEQGILNYVRALNLLWLNKGSIQLLRTKNLDFHKSGKIWIESGKLAIFSRSRSGVNNKHFFHSFRLPIINSCMKQLILKLYANISRKKERVNQKTGRNFDKILLFTTSKTRLN